MTKKHHYFSNSRVAKLFASEQGKGAQEGEIFFKAISQVLNGMISYKDIQSILPDIYNNVRNDMRKARLKYPIILIDSLTKLYSHDVYDKIGDNIPVNIEKNFMLETNYAYREPGSQSKYFLIDICSFDTLPLLLVDIEGKDVAATKEILWNI